MTKCNTIWIDETGLIRAIQEACVKMLDNVFEKLKEAFSLEIMFAGAGRTKWKENAGKEFKKISTELTRDVIEMTVGLNPDIPNRAWSDNYAAQIMVALFGNHPPIETKPGLEVFKDHMESRGISNAVTVYPLPNFSWPEPGAEEILSNAMKLTKKYFEDGMKTIADGINFYDYVYVN